MTDPEGTRTIFESAHELICRSILNELATSIHYLVCDFSREHSEELNTYESVLTMHTAVQSALHPIWDATRILYLDYFASLIYPCA